MELGMIGLGRMGTNMVRRLMRDGHRCIVYDIQREAVCGGSDLRNCIKR
jgi:6-phosphogluconate dehydrogenase